MEAQLNLDDLRAEAVRSRGFVRGAETQLTKFIDMIDAARAGTPDLPAAPTAVRFEPASGSVRVTWDPVPGAMHYVYWWREDPMERGGTVTGHSVVVPLADGDTFYVAAVDERGTGPESSAVYVAP